MEDMFNIIVSDTIVEFLKNILDENEIILNEEQEIALSKAILRYCRSYMKLSYERNGDYNIVISQRTLINTDQGISYKMPGEKDNYFQKRAKTERKILLKKFQELGVKDVILEASQFVIIATNYSSLHYVVKADRVKTQKERLRRLTIKISSRHGEEPMEVFSKMV